MICNTLLNYDVMVIKKIRCQYPEENKKLKIKF